MKRHNLVFLITTLGVGVLTARAAASFDIVIDFVGSYTPAQQEAARQAELLWEESITGYQPGINLTEITVELKTFSEGIGGTLGRAYSPRTVWRGGFWLSTGGVFELDTFDMPSLERSGRLDDVIAHEIGHLLGIGTLWRSNGVYVLDSGEYTGPFGVAAYNAEFDQDGSIIPVEMEGDAGTANTHWDENNNGSGFTGIRDVMGRDFRNELMTGWLNTNPFLSNTTIQSMRDLGFTVVPETAGLTLLVLGFTMMAAGRRRKDASGNIFP